MNTPYRVNVASGRQLESVAHYSRALRVGDTVLQSGTTAIDRQGNVRGEGDVARQVEAILKIAEWSMGKAGGRLADVVRARIYLTDIAVSDVAARALARYFRDARPASTLVQVNGLARPTQLIEIEFDAVDGAGASAQRISSGGPLEDVYAYSRAVRIGDRVFISGSTALRPAASRARATCTGRHGPRWRRSSGRSARPAARRATSSTPRRSSPISARPPTTPARSSRPWGTRARSTLLGVPALVRPELLVEIEAEAVIGAARTRRDIYTQHMREKPRAGTRAPSRWATRST